jgi:hypothetical protein
MRSFSASTLVLALPKVKMAGMYRKQTENCIQMVFQVLYRKKPLGRVSRRWKGNIKINLKNMQSVF